MKSEWKIVKASDFISFNPRLSIKKNTEATKIAMDKLQPFTKSIPSIEKAVFSGGSKFCNGDTIMARITPCLENGKTAFINVLKDDEIGFGSTEFIVLRAIPEVSDPQFVYYLATSPEFRNVAIKSMVGSSGRQRVQQSVLDNLELSVPSLEEQRKIASILKSLDDKIELNNKINKNLEQQAQAIYKSWFVDFEPFGGNAPEDWLISTLGSIASIKTNSFSPAKTPNVMVEHYSIPAFDEQHYPVFEMASGIKSNKYILTPASVMISKLNPDTKRIWRPLCLSEHPVCSTEFIVYEANNPAHKDYVYAILDSDAFFAHLCSHTTGSTNSRQRATPKTTLDFQVMMPPDSIIEEFCAMVTPMYDMIASNIVENQSLAHTRNVLLPKLMSGELDISSLDL